MRWKTAHRRKAHQMERSRNAIIDLPLRRVYGRHWLTGMVLYGVPDPTASILMARCFGRVETIEKAPGVFEHSWKPTTELET
jgi:hypothetical protein